MTNVTTIPTTIVVVCEPPNRDTSMPHVVVELLFLSMNKKRLSSSQDRCEGGRGIVNGNFEIHLPRSYGLFANDVKVM